jgi:hypothetical protein
VWVSTYSTRLDLTPLLYWSCCPRTTRGGVFYCYGFVVDAVLFSLWQHNQEAKSIPNRSIYPCEGAPSKQASRGEEKILAFPRTAAAAAAAQTTHAAVVCSTSALSLSSTALSPPQTQTDHLRAFVLLLLLVLLHLGRTRPQQQPTKNRMIPRPFRYKGIHSVILYIMFVYSVCAPPPQPQQQEQRQGSHS